MTVLNPAEFSSFDSKPISVDDISCKTSGGCFVASYPPVAKPGQMGDFFVNTYLLQPDRKFETLGPATVRSSDVEKCMK
jgi:hypothetical protein